VRNVRLTVAYDGTAYYGFQLQAGQPTIQSALEQAIRQVTQESSRVIGAGRTDTGVHAVGQVVNFRTTSALPLDELQRALNAVLPDDIAVSDIREAPDDFHARFSARSREYCYTILNRPVADPLRRHIVYHYARPLDVTLMDTACQHLVGRHDFASFGSQTSARGTTRRTVYRAGCRREGDYVLVDITADAFLAGMVRSIVGTLLEVGTGKLTPDDFQAILLAADRRRSGPAAPARGLCLTKVNY
jgi:tRNA pseudouridine38-40 synthase